jgi:hypothetical protein
MTKRIISSILTILFAVILLTSFTEPAFAWAEAEFRPLSSYEKPAFIFNALLPDDLVKGLLYGFGTALGGVGGTITACYAVDVLYQFSKYRLQIKPPIYGFVPQLRQ